MIKGIIIYIQTGDTINRLIIIAEHCLDCLILTASDHFSAADDLCMDIFID